jgi:hypothetical protein
MMKHLSIAVCWLGWGVAGILAVAPLLRAGSVMPEHPLPAAPRGTTVACEPSPHAANVEKLLRLATAETARERLARLAADAEWRLRRAELEAELAQSRAQIQTPVFPEPRRADLRSAEPTNRTESAPPVVRLRAPSPRVRLIGSDAHVTGKVSNRGSEEVWAYLTLELLRDERILEERDLEILVPAGGEAAYSHVFSTSLGDGTYSARALLAE